MSPSSPVDVLLSRGAKMKKITSGRASFINATLQNLRAEGASAVPAIGEFLRRGDDVAFAEMRGGELVGHRTLRQAMIATLLDIGGSEAIGVALAQLQQTRQPVEIAMLARGVEAEEPDVHGEQVIRAVDDALQWAEQSQVSAKVAPDVSPLFDVLSRYGDEHAIAVLERSVARWGEYALIALAGLRDGAGVPSLMTLASADDGPFDDRALPLRVLAQTTLEYPEARDELVDLTRAGRIPDQVWSAMAETLSGKYLRLSSTMFDGTPLVERRSDASGNTALRRSFYIAWRNVRYEQDVVAADWSAEQVEQQRALIDDLLAATPSAAAVQALQQARVALDS